MPLINNYTISGLESLKRFPDMRVAQFTCNGRIWPGKRKTVEALRAVKPYHRSKVLVHWDFIYILSRYAMFSYETKQAILKELVALMDYANYDKSIIGIVMHMDWSLKKGITSKTDPSKIKDSYQGSVWNNRIQDMVADNYYQWIEINLMEFYHDLVSTVPPNWKPGCKIYLENTTKLGPINEGALTHLEAIIDDNQGYEKVFGICCDTEHHYAVTGEYKDPVIYYNFLKAKGIDCVIHLNTIPEEVKPKSGKDRHSETTVFECSYLKDSQYFDIVTRLIENDIPFVREVKEDTMFRELNQMKEKWTILQ